jgi:hypothetical protein
MSPRAIYCPTCGAPVEDSPTPRPKPKKPAQGDSWSENPAGFGWAIVRAFWGILFLAIVAALI